MLEDGRESGSCADHVDVVAGRYRLGPALRRSAGCCAHRAYDELLQRTVRVTLVESDPTGEGPFSLRPQGWHDRDPEVAELFDAGHEHDRLFLVTHHPDEPTLAETTPPGGLDLGQLRELGTAVATALAPRHRRGAAHGGLGAGTVAFTPQGTSLAEFGLLPWLARWGDVPVAPPYVAPEQRAGADPGPASDVYALGRLLGELAPDHGLRPGLRTLLTEMTAADPGARPSMEEVRRRLAGRAGRRPATRTGKRRLGLVAAACCLVGLGVGLSALAGEVPAAVGSDGATLAATAAVPTPVIPLGPLLSTAPSPGDGEAVSYRSGSGRTTTAVVGSACGASDGVASDGTASDGTASTAKTGAGDSPRVVDAADRTSTGSQDGSDAVAQPSRTTAPDRDRTTTPASTRPAPKTDSQRSHVTTRPVTAGIVTRIAALGRHGQHGAGDAGTSRAGDRPQKATSRTLIGPDLPDPGADSS